MADNADIHVLCRTCGRPFVLDADARRSFEAIAKAAGWTYVVTPRHCRACRKARRLDPAWRRF